jgi:hypothetical protein
VQSLRLGPTRGGALTIFDLYLQLYRRVPGLVAQEVPDQLRQSYGQLQEPELTILTGAGAFAIALRGGGGRGVVVLGLAGKRRARRVSITDSGAMRQQLLARGQLTRAARGDPPDGRAGGRASSSGAGRGSGYAARVV